MRTYGNTKGTSIDKRDLLNQRHANIRNMKDKFLLKRAQTSIEPKKPDNFISVLNAIQRISLSKLSSTSTAIHWPR